MEDGVSEGMYLVTTIFTFIALTPTDAVVARVSDTTFSTSWDVTACTLKHEVQTSIVIWKPLVEVLYRELHTTSVLQGLHAVKG